MLTHAVGFNGTFFFFFFLRRPECAACTLALCGSVGVKLPLNVSTSRLCSGAISKARRPKKTKKKRQKSIWSCVTPPPQTAGWTTELDWLLYQVWCWHRTVDLGQWNGNLNGVEIKTYWHKLVLCSGLVLECTHHWMAGQFKSLPLNDELCMSFGL